MCWGGTPADVRQALQLLGSPQPFRFGKDTNPPVTEVTQGRTVTWDTGREREKQTRQMCGRAGMVWLRAETQSRGQWGKDTLLPVLCVAWDPVSQPWLGWPSFPWNLGLLFLCPTYLCLWRHSSPPAAMCNFKSVFKSGHILGTQINTFWLWMVSSEFLSPW